jgi:hypothetical protein
MTVASLWKALDRARCGKAVGAKEIVDHDRFQKKVNPWNYNQLKGSPKIQNRPTLAVDLSIWICESLTSSAMAENHASPALHLVYTRTLKLLSLGVKLVIVIEGKKRIRRTDPGEQDNFRKRRSGTNFWRACQSCEEMLKLLGVPVVRAKAEGEALCALLNQRGIVDGVISNDGDCLLFGAKVLYTKFSIENLDQSRVMRYDMSDIRAFVDDDDTDEFHEQDKTNTNQAGDFVDLGRDDLIAFALLTGSDMAGDGLPKIGCRKAIRFIRKCQLDNPMKQKTAAIEELKSWERAASATNHTTPDPKETTTMEQRCSCCCHPGTKRSHQKHGCKLCGTEPSEPCFQVSPGGRFRKSLRAKALAMEPKFNPTMVLAAYLLPNDNQIPYVLVGKTARTLEIEPPRLREMLHSSLIVKGYGLGPSRYYVRQSLGRLLVRSHLFQQTKKSGNENATKMKLSHDKPVPQKIVKRLTRNDTPSFEIQWTVSATMTDEEGNGLDGHQFLTVEDQRMIQKCYPDLIKIFEEVEKETMKQGDAEQQRRREFLESFLSKTRPPVVEEVDRSPPKKKRDRQTKHRPSFFGHVPVNCAPGFQNVEASGEGDDVKQLMGIDYHQVRKGPGERAANSERHTRVRNSGGTCPGKSKPRRTLFPKGDPAESIEVGPRYEILIHPEISDHLRPGQKRDHRGGKRNSKSCGLAKAKLDAGDDVQNILRFAIGQVKDEDGNDFDFSSIESESHSSGLEEAGSPPEASMDRGGCYEKTSGLKPSDKYFLAVEPTEKCRDTCAVTEEHQKQVLEFSEQQGLCYDRRLKPEFWPNQEQLYIPSLGRGNEIMDVQCNRLQSDDTEFQKQTFEYHDVKNVESHKAVHAKFCDQERLHGLPHPDGNKQFQKLAGDEENLPVYYAEHTDRQYRPVNLTKEKKSSALHFQCDQLGLKTSTESWHQFPQHSSIMNKPCETSCHARGQMSDRELHIVSRDGCLDKSIEDYSELAHPTWEQQYSHGHSEIQRMPQVEGYQDDDHHQRYNAQYDDFESCRYYPSAFDIKDQFLPNNTSEEEWEEPVKSHDGTNRAEYHFWKERDKGVVSKFEARQQGGRQWSSRDETCRWYHSEHGHIPRREFWTAEEKKDDSYHAPHASLNGNQTKVSQYRPFGRDQPQYADSYATCEALENMQRQARLHLECKRHLMGVDESFWGLPVLFDEIRDAGVRKMPQEYTEGDRYSLDDSRRQLYSWNEHRDESLGYQGMSNATDKVQVGDRLDLYYDVEYNVEYLEDIAVAIELDISPHAKHRRRGAD